MKKLINRFTQYIKGSTIKTLLFSVVIAFLTLLLSFVIFAFTPLIRSLNIVGDNKIISSERLLKNIVSLDNDLSVDELVFKYFMGEGGDRENFSYGRIIKAITQIDSLNNEVELWRAYAYNISQVIDGTKKPISADSVVEIGRATGDVVATRSALDTLLRNQVATQMEKLESESLVSTKHKIYPPVNGQITTHFNHKHRVYGITISTSKMAPVMSVGDGTIISSIWTPEDAYIIQVQHAENMISIYRGLTRPLKDKGDRVSSREVIGYIGAGAKDDLSDTLINVLNPQSPANLYFELWQNGNVIDPEKYIIF